MLWVVVAESWGTLCALTFKIPLASLVSPNIDMRRLDLPCDAMLAPWSYDQFTYNLRMLTLATDPTTMCN